MTEEDKKTSGGVVFFVIACLTVTALAVGTFAVRADPARIAERAAKAAVIKDLKDPESAQFRSVYVNPTNDCVSGGVNAKNSYGAYVGFTTFVSRKQEFGNWDSMLRPVLEGDTTKEFENRFRQCIGPR